MSMRKGLDRRARGQSPESLGGTSHGIVAFFFLSRSFLMSHMQTAKTMKVLNNPSWRKKSAI
jgi:hypothetical protein